jgi:hypothetical protein
MNTERLIDMLSTNVEPVKGGQLWKTLAWAIAVSGIAAFGVMVATVGIRNDVAAGREPISIALELVFSLSLVAAGAVILMKSMIPGQEERKRSSTVLLPLFAASAAAIAMLVRHGPITPTGMMGSAAAALCMMCIPFFAVIPFAVLIWVLRKGAPTDLRRCGAVAGLVAGAIGATVYSFNCPSDALPFVAFWYAAAIGLCAIIGAQLGPRLLRW